METKRILENEQFVHEEHKNWLSQLNFYQDQIKFFQNELAKVLQAQEFSYSAIETVDEYRAIFLKKLSAIDEMRYSITVHERALAHPPTMDDVELMDHQMVRDRFLDFVEKFELMKKNFRRFAAYND